LGEEWLSETEVPEEFDEEMGRRFAEGATSVGGKHGVYVDIAMHAVFVMIGMGCSDSVARLHLKLIEPETATNAEGSNGGHNKAILSQ
jgi:hypothetical protein